MTDSVKEEKKEELRPELKMLDLIEEEYKKAFATHGSFRSPHEGYAIIKEEMDELWDEVKKKPLVARSRPAMKNEAKQVAAMALRFMIDCEITFDMEG